MVPAVLRAAEAAYRNSFCRISHWKYSAGKVGSCLAGRLGLGGSDIYWEIHVAAREVKL